MRHEAVLFKKSRFYSRVRMGRRLWQRRYFVLDDDPRHPLRYHRLSLGSAAGGFVGGEPLLNAFVPIDLHAVRSLELVGGRELHLHCAARKHTLRGCDADAPAAAMQAWFDHVLVRIDELRAHDGAHDDCEPEACAWA